MLIILAINLNICFRCSKEPPHSFEKSRIKSWVYELWSKSSRPLVLQATREWKLSPSLFELSYPFKIEGFFLVPQSTRLLSLWRPHCFHTMYHEDGISVLGTDKSQKEPYQEKMGDEEGFQIHIQSQQSWQLVTCWQGRSPARAEHRKSVFLASFLRFPGAPTIS